MKNTPSAPRVLAGAVAAAAPDVPLNVVFTENDGSVRGKRGNQEPMVAAQYDPDSKMLWVGIPINQTPTLSDSGKSYILGNVKFGDASVLCGGKRVYVNAVVGAYANG